MSELTNELARSALERLDASIASSVVEPCKTTDERCAVYLILEVEASPEDARELLAQTQRIRILAVRPQAELELTEADLLDNDDLATPAITGASDDGSDGRRATTALPVEDEESP